MKRAILWLLALAMLGGLGLFAWRLVDERRFAATPYGEGSRTVNIPSGTGPRALAKLLADARVVSDANRFFSHLHWFRRNARIYSNVVKLADSPNERVLVIFGAGHLGWLRQDFATDSNLQLRKLSDFAK